ncbi:hypothetical protein FS842_001802 [Serendipita sp. 407]|nr:hypothetical protein FS842_001802 [Serendipita sp. 407]
MTSNPMREAHVSVLREHVMPSNDIKKTMGVTLSTAQDTMALATTTTGLSQSVVPFGNAAQCPGEDEQTTHVFLCCLPAAWFAWLRVPSISRATTSLSAEPNESQGGGGPCQHRQTMSLPEEEMVDMEAHRQRIADAYEWPSIGR